MTVKRVFIFILLIALIACLSGCSSRGDSADNIEARKICNFTRLYNKVNIGVNQRDNIYVDELTGVIYVFLNSDYYGGGGFTPLYNADGSLKIWDGYKKGGSNVQQEVKAQD